LFGGFPGDEDAGDDMSSTVISHQPPPRYSGLDAATTTTRNGKKLFENDGGNLVQALCNTLYINSSLQVK
jgi:hypothetical protein